MEVAAAGLIAGAFGNASQASALTMKVITLVAGGISVTAAKLPMPPKCQGPLSSQDVAPSGLPLAQALPWCALQEAGQDPALPASSADAHIYLTSCRWSAHNPYGRATNLQADGTIEEVDPMSRVVSLSVTDSKGKKRAIRNLKEPFVLALPLAKLNLTQDDLEQMMMEGCLPECRFWNETELRWSRDGCKTRSIRHTDSGPELLCACTHLTTFAAFKSPIEIVSQLLGDVSQFLCQTLVICARVGALFSPEGLEALQQGRWATRDSATVFFLPSILISLLLIATAVRDIRRRKELPWIWSAIEHVAWPTCSSLIADVAEFLGKPWRWPLRFARFAMESVVASQLGVNQATLKILEEAKYSGPGYTPTLQELSGRSQNGVAAKVVQASLQMALYKDLAKDKFAFRHMPSLDSVGRLKWAGSLLRRLIILQCQTFWAVHLLNFPLLIDLYTFSSQRVVVLAVQFLGSLFGCALYFQQTTALTFRSPAKCATTSFGQRVQKAIPISVVSALISTGSSQLLYNMISVRPRPDQIIGQQVDRAMGVLFYVLGLSLCGFFLLYIAAFLANVDAESAESWVLTAAWTVTNSIILTPLAQSFFFVAWPVIYLQRYPSLLDEIFVQGGELEDVGNDPETPQGATIKKKVLVRGAPKVDACEADLAQTGSGASPSVVEVSGFGQCQEPPLPGQLVGDAIVISVVPVARRQRAADRSHCE